MYVRDTVCGAKSKPDPATLDVGGTVSQAKAPSTYSYI